MFNRIRVSTPEQISARHRAEALRRISRYSLHQATVALRDRRVALAARGLAADAIEADALTHAIVARIAAFDTK